MYATQEVSVQMHLQPLCRLGTSDGNELSLPGILILLAGFSANTGILNLAHRGLQCKAVFPHLFSLVFPLTVLIIYSLRLFSLFKTEIQTSSLNYRVFQADIYGG